MGQELRAAGVRQAQLSSLEPLGAQADEHHKSVVGYCKKAILEAKAAGELLIRAKEGCKHGSFEDWVESQREFSVETARKYMRLCQGWDELVERYGPTGISNLTIDSGLAALSKKPPKPKTPPVEIVEGTTECLHGGPHIYDEEACTRCHDPRPEAGSEPDESGRGSQEEGVGRYDADDERAADVFEGDEQEGAVDPPEKMAHRLLDELEKTFREGIRLTTALAHCIKDKHTLAEIENSLDVGYKDLQKLRRSK